MSGYVNHIVVCGYEMGSGMLLDVLSSEIDIEEQRVVLFGPYERPKELRPEFLWVQGDPTKESELDKVRITHASTVIVTGSRRIKPQEADAATILTVFTIRSALTRSPVTQSRKAPVRIIAEILDSENVQHARTAGSDEVVETRRVGYSLLAHTIVYPGVADATSRMVFSGNQNLYVGEVPTATQMPVGFDQLSRQIRATTGCMVIGLRDPKTGQERVNPGSDTIVTAGMQVLYLGSAPHLERA